MRGKNKEAVFIALSCISISTLFGSFAGNLESFEIYKQKGDVFIIFENDKIPYGLNKNKAELIAQKYNSDLLMKSLLIGISGVSAATALLLSNLDFDEIELNYEIKKIEISAQKQLKTEQIKNKYALMSAANREQFRLEIAALLELTGGDETMDASEVNATDKMINISYLLADGHDINAAISMAFNVQPGTREHTLKKLEYEDWVKGSNVE